MGVITVSPGSLCLGTFFLKEFKSSRLQVLLTKYGAKIVSTVIDPF